MPQPTLCFNCVAVVEIVVAVVVAAVVVAAIVAVVVAIVVVAVVVVVIVVDIVDSNGAKKVSPLKKDKCSKLSHSQPAEAHQEKVISS